MNDKIKDLLSTAYKTDSIEKNKWRIENREQLREQRKKELKELMEKEKTMSNNKQSSELKLDLRGMTARQYAMLILRDDLKYSWQRCGNKMEITRYAARELYKRAKDKCE